ncbi:hypothetical protein FFH90_015395 [Pseudomonas sp. ATCC 43928]|nr:hypothetical protein FFH90_015395 [Pseudomonas sp. ATCC 43928]
MEWGLFGRAQKRAAGKGRYLTHIQLLRRPEPIVPTLPRGNASCDALRHGGRGASVAALPRRAWERSVR